MFCIIFNVLSSFPLIENQRAGCSAYSSTNICKLHKSQPVFFWLFNVLSYVIQRLDSIVGWEGESHFSTYMGPARHFVQPYPQNTCTFGKFQNIFPFL